MRSVIGVDLGGTNVRAAVVTESGDLLEATRREDPSRAQDGADAVIQAMAHTIQAAADAYGGPIDAVGIAIPGSVDDDLGVVEWSPNFGETVNGVFRYWSHVPIRGPISKLIDFATFMGNDANLAALGEYKFGSGRDSANALVMFTLGTGVGSGAVMGKQSYIGPGEGPILLLGGNKFGVELGHMIIQHGGLDCSAGEYGAVEAYCQRDAIIRRAQHRLRRGRKSVIYDLVEGDFGRITPLIISQACERGDEVAIEVFAEIGEFLGVGIANAINVFAPDVVAVGGQIAKAGDFILEPARKMARNCAIPTLFRDAKIVMAEQIDDAGILGGAALALARLS